MIHKKKVNRPKRAAYLKRMTATRAEGRPPALNHERYRTGNEPNDECRQPATSQPTYGEKYNKT
jgi:hypothetical protein